MTSQKDVSKELEQLAQDVKRLKETSARSAWGNPHEIATQAMAAVDFYRSYYGSGPGFGERLRNVVEILKVQALNRARAGEQATGAGFLYGFAKLLEDAYLGNQLHLEACAELNRRRIEEGRRKRKEAQDAD